MAAVPYKVEKNGEKWNVVNEDTGEVKATRPTEEAAKRQLRLLEAVEHDEGWQ